MDITLRTDIGGYFSYRIYRETPDNIIYESPVQKNLIVNSGLKHLYSLSIPAVMQVLDIGNSNIPPSPSDTGLKGASFNNSNIFNDLLALYVSGGPVEDSATSEYTAFFRTKTASSPTVLKEFVIKPGVNQDAFARQIFSSITLQAGDGIEFTYKVVVNWQCAPTDTTFKLYYTKNTSDDINSFTSDQLPLIWDSVSGAINNKLWSSLAFSDTTIVAVASSTTDTNITYSIDAGMNWLSASAPETAAYTLNTPLNDVAYGEIINGSNSLVPSFVAVGNNYLYYSETGTVWLTAAPSSYNNWTGIAFGRPSRIPTLSNPSPYSTTFVAVANNGASRIMKSDDTVNWTNISSSVMNSINWSAITYGKYYVAVADSGTHRIGYSTDGITWLSAAAPALNEWSDIAYNSEKDLYVAVSKNSTYSPIMYASGGDITKWYPARSPYSASWHGVTFGNSIFVAVGESDLQPRAIYSNDAINWFPVNFISFNEVWKSVTYSNGTFIAVASSTGSIEKPFARSEVNTRGSNEVEVNAKIALISIPDRVYNPNFYMYTLRDFEMPFTCSITPATANELFYSTTRSTNSYTQANSVLLSPNTAVGVYMFDNTIGHGAIKNLLITDTISPTGYYTPGVWAIELNADNITDPVVYTGTIDEIVTIAPEPGSITRSISSTIGDIVDNKLQFNVFHTWGEPANIAADGANIAIDTNTDLVSPASNASTVVNTVIGSTNEGTVETNPYAIITIPNWTVIDATEYSNGFYAPYLDAPVGLYKTKDNIDVNTGILDCTNTYTLNTNYYINFSIRIANINNGPVINSGKTDVLARVVIDPIVQGYSGYSSIVSSLQTVSQTTSASSIIYINDAQVTSSDILSEINTSSARAGISPFVEDIQIIKDTADTAKLKIIFSKTPQYRPDYVVVTREEVVPRTDGQCPSLPVGETYYIVDNLNTQYQVIYPA